MKKFLAFLVTVVVTAGITACVCLFVIQKKDGAQNNTTSANNQTTESGNTQDGNKNGNVKYEEIVAKYDIADESWIKNGKGAKVAFNEDKDGMTGLSITGIEKNSNGTYTIKGVVYKPYEFTEEELKELKETGKITIYGEKYEEKADIYGIYGLYKVGKNEEYAEYIIEDRKKLKSNDQWGLCYRITDKHMEITVDADTLVLGASELDMEEGNGKTVAELYNSKKDFDDESGKNKVKVYNFVFKDNKCIEMYCVPYES